MNFGPLASRPLAKVSGVSLTATGQTTLFTVPTGRTLLVTGILVRATTVTGFTSLATAQVGKSAGYNQIVAAASVPLDAVDEYVNLMGSQTALAFSAGDVLALDVTVAAVATALSVEVLVFGILM